MPDFVSAFGARCSRPLNAPKNSSPCVTLGPLIHNPQEVERLRRAGIRSVETLDEVAPGETVIIRSHGVTPDVYRTCEARGIPVIDATCPHVAHIHELVEQYSGNGDAVVIVGEADHPEVIGIAGLGARKGFHSARRAGRRRGGTAGKSARRRADDDSARSI